MELLFVIIIGYFIGNIPFSYIFTKIFTQRDIRMMGSGNVGATNAFRSGGNLAGILSLLADMLKGFISAWAGLNLGGEAGTVLASLAVVIGHCYPLLLKFKGGKGVASVGGVVIFLMPHLILPLAVIFFAIMFISRFVSLSSMGAAFFLPFLAFYSAQTWHYCVMALILAVFLIYKHKENIKRLREGNENTIKWIDKMFDSQNF
ncbi:MAG: glycerol-3-phosphate 1-O-acyltransferase PlsY [Syntrophomonadaceae bacterium]|nr:glycerol-3-phosphate 1-O-acyltransferase PlsY [Syntrophomonadaceae bacterium]